MLDPIVVKLWRLENGVTAPVAPDDEDYLTLETIGVRLRAEGRRLVASDIATGELLRTNHELLAALAAAEQARQEAERRAVAEAAARQQLEEELERLRAELARRQGPG